MVNFGFTRGHFVRALKIIIFKQTWVVSIAIHLPVSQFSQLVFLRRKAAFLYFSLKVCVLCDDIDSRSGVCESGIAALIQVLIGYMGEHLHARYVYRALCVLRAIGLII